MLLHIEHMFHNLSILNFFEFIILNIFILTLFVLLLLKFNESLRKKFFASFYSLNHKFHDDYNEFKDIIKENYNFGTMSTNVRIKNFIIYLSYNINPRIF